jgi:hypothetical protein
MKGILLPSSLLLLPFLLLATSNAAGYRYGASDQAFYTPAVMQRLEPRLFPADTPLLNVQAHLTLADEAVAELSRLTGLELPELYLTLYGLTLVLMGGAVFCVGATMYGQWWTSVVLLAGISLRHAIARSGTNTLEGYFHTRQLAFALGMLAACAFLRNKNAIVLFLMVCAAALHPTTTLWFVVWLGTATFLAEPRWRRGLTRTMAATLPFITYGFLQGPLVGRLARMDAEWIAAIGEKDYLFPLQWPPHAWAINLSYPLIIGLTWWLRRRSGVLRPRETALVLGSASLLVIFLCALLFQVFPVALAVQLQPARVFWMLDFLAVVYLAWLLAEYITRGRRWAAITVAITVAILATARGVYVMRVEFPDRPLVQARIPNDDWGRVMAFARSTDPSSGWLAEPAHAARYGTSVRVAGERDVFVEALKDMPLGMYDRGIAIRTRDRLRELADFQSLSATHARQLATTYNLKYLVTAAALDLPIVFETRTLRVYRLRD